MTTTARNLARLAALPALSHVWHVAGEVIVTAALGFVDTTDADTTEQAPTDPGYSYSPDTHEKSAPTATGGRPGHHGPQHIANLLNRRRRGPRQRPCPPNGGHDFHPVSPPVARQTSRRIHDIVISSPEHNRPNNQKTTHTEGLKK